MQENERKEEIKKQQQFNKELQEFNKSKSSEEHDDTSMSKVLQSEVLDI